MAYNWQDAKRVTGRQFTCGYCDCFCAPDVGFRTDEGQAIGVGHHSRPVRAFILICPNCRKPTFFDYSGQQIPVSRKGRGVGGIHDSEVLEAYNEARNCSGVNASTASVLLCRKILMNIAVKQGADEGKTFAYYIDYLDSGGYVPPNGREWVDEVRRAGNLATHEMPSVSQADAEQILYFIEMLLRFIYEFPSLVGRKSL